MIGTLADIVEKSASLKAPALIVVGEVVELREPTQLVRAGHRESGRNMVIGEEEFIGL